MTVIRIFRQFLILSSIIITKNLSVLLKLFSLMGISMFTFTGRTLAFAVILNLPFILPAAYADELGSFGDRIFQFQEKLALRGNTLAEYKLGTLYEFGVSVEPNEQKAIHWYQKAADDDYLPAKNRLTFLEVRRSGFDKNRHADWLENLVKLAQSSDPNAMILLGQMYRNGIHLKKNLTKALYFLERASSIGHTEVDSQIDSIKREMEANTRKKNEAEAAAREQEAKEKPKKSRPAKPARSAEKKATVKKKPTAKKPAIETKEEKRLKYEAAMRKLREEAKLLEQQQKWAESEE